MTMRSKPLLALFGLALLIRLAALFVISFAFGAAQEFSIDAQSYHQIAQNLVERGVFASTIDPPYLPDVPGTFRPPLTPLYLAAWYAVFGVNLLWGRIGLAVISAVSCGLTFWLGERLFDRTVGLIAGLISCVYPFFLLLAHVPLTETLSIFLTLLLIALLYAPQFETRLCWHSVALGAAFGLLLLNKASNATIFSCALLWAGMRFIKMPRRGIAALALMLAVAALLILPWTLRNYRATGAFIPINSNGGWTFYLGNSPATEYNVTLLEQGTANGWTPAQDAYLPFADLALTDVNARDQRASALARRFIADHPAQFLRLALRKLMIFWRPYPHVMDKITWIPLAIFGGIGLCCSLAQWRRHLAIYALFGSSMLIPVFFTSMPRFRAPLIPFIIIYAAFAIARLRTFFSKDAKNKEKYVRDCFSL